MELEMVRPPANGTRYRDTWVQFRTGECVSYGVQLWLRGRTYVEHRFTSASTRAVSMSVQLMSSTDYVRSDH